MIIPEFLNSKENIISLILEISLECYPSFIDTLKMKSTKKMQTSTFTAKLWRVIKELICQTKKKKEK